MIELLAAALLTAGAPQQQAAPQGQRIGQYSVVRYTDDCVVTREYRMQGQSYWLWIDTDGTNASLQILSPQWRDLAGQTFTHRLSLNGQIVAEQMHGVRGPDRMGGYAVGVSAQGLMELMPEVATIRVDDARGGLVWGGSTAGIADAIVALRDCAAGLGREP